jgi:hypothetical protein
MPKLPAKSLNIPTSDEIDDTHSGENSQNGQGKAVIERDLLIDTAAPGDRRVIAQKFCEVYSRFGIEQSKLSEYAELSVTSLSKITKSGDVAGWSTWQKIIGGLVRYGANHMYEFWTSLPISTQQALRERSFNPILVQYIEEYDKSQRKDQQAIVDSINDLYILLKPEEVGEDFLNRIIPYGISQSPLLGDKSQQNLKQTSTGSASIHCNGDIRIKEIDTLLVLPSTPENADLVSSILNEKNEKSNNEVVTVPEKITEVRIGSEQVSIGHSSIHSNGNIHIGRIGTLVVSPETVNGSSTSNLIDALLIKGNNKAPS